MERRKIILDCDPGHDDAIAILLAGKSKYIELLGITVVAGNQTLEKTTKNALNVCQYLELDVPVYAGCGQPMIRDKQVISEEIHGESGLDGPAFEILERKAEEKHAVYSLCILEPLYFFLLYMIFFTFGSLWKIFHLVFQYISHTFQALQTRLAYVLT